MNEEVTVEDLAENETDALVAYTKGGLGAIPYFGTLFGEVASQIIPNQRIDRISKFVIILESKLKKLQFTVEELKQKIQKEEYVNLFEEGVWQAARSSSQERKEYISSLLTNSLTDEAINEIQQGVLLSLLGDLNDNEVIILFGSSMRVRLGRESEFQKKHENVLMKPLVHMSSPQEELDIAAVYETYRGKLVNLNLLKRDFKKPKKGEVPEFDEKTGMIKATGYSLTPLGRLLLKYIDMPDEH